MGIVELKLKIEQEFKKLIEQHGFKYIKSQRAFRKKTPFGHLSIHFMYATYEGLLLNPEVAIRYDEIVNMRAKSLNVNPKEWKQNASVGHYLDVVKGYETGADMFHSPNQNYVYTDNDIPKAVNLIYQDVIDFGFPFFEKYSKPEEVYTLCRDFFGKRYVPTQKRAVTGVALSYLYCLGNFDEDVKYFRGCIQDPRNHEEVRERLTKEYDIFIGYIKNNSTI